MSNYFHDQAALDVATQIMALVNGPKLLGGDAQLKAKIQCLIIDVLEQYGRKPSAGEPKPKYRERSNHDVIRREQSQPCYCWAENDHRIGEEVAAPPAAAHGDEAVLWELLDESVNGGDEQQIMARAKIRHLVAMRAQGDGEVQ